MERSLLIDKFLKLEVTDKAVVSVADAKAYEIQKAKEDLATYLRLKQLELEAKRAELKQLTGRQLERIVVLGGANRNDLLVELTEKATGLTVVLGPAEGSTLGNLALQLAVGEGQELTAGTMRRWAERLSRAAFHNES